MRTTSHNETIIEYEDLDMDIVHEVLMDILAGGTVSNNSHKRRRRYYNLFFTMDIETSTYGRLTDHPIAFTYSIAIYIANKCILFRTWEQYLTFIYHLSEIASKFTRIVCYVHNLPYEFQFMRDFVHVSELFATAPRKVVKFFSQGVEYRCSYKLTNMGLDRFTSTIPTMKYGKLSGEEFDYSKLRTPRTYLEPKELSYIYNDVRGLYDAIEYTIENDSYNIATIPLTSTGFVRNDLRKVITSNPANRLNFLKCRLNQRLYGLLREARRGGNTHCNPVYSDMELEDLTSQDMSSAYPAVEVQCKFPVSPFYPCKESRLADFEEFIGKYACLINVTFSNIYLKKLATVPYIAKAHCTQIRNVIGDNGRVLSAEKLSMVITDIDYDIIKETYEWAEVECLECYVAEYGYLNDELRNELIREYKNKTTLKDGDPYYYMKEKNKFNANFGCMLTDICQDSVEYMPESDRPFVTVKESSYTQQLDDYYNSRRNFLQYQHGVWITAHCRRRLQNAINKLGDEMVYCDTDSAKFFNTSANRLIFEKLNAQIRKEIEECGIDCSFTWTNKQGKTKTYTLGIWEEDGDYKYFKSMGAKKYCYVDNEETIRKDNINKILDAFGYEEVEQLLSDFRATKLEEILGKTLTVPYDVFHITVAGLSKSKACRWLEEHGGIDAFTAGTVVPAGSSGRTSAIYNDWKGVKEITINGEKIKVGSNMVIQDTTYKFSLTEEYEELLTNISEGVIW